jgi:TnpA family transposase
MDELLEKYQKLDEAHQQELLAFVDNLLLREKLEQSSADLSNYKERINKVSVWSDEHIEQMEKDLKSIGKWTIPEW